jgi:hypothetical protein
MAEQRAGAAEQELDWFIETFDGEVEDARSLIQAEGEAARQQIDDQLRELQQFAAGGATVETLLQGAEPSVWFLSIPVGELPAVLQHDAPIGAAYRGGPLLDSGGRVVAVSSRS